MKVLRFLSYRATEISKPGGPGGQDDTQLVAFVLGVANQNLLRIDRPHVETDLRLGLPLLYQ